MKTISQLCEAAREFTDAGTWKHSWHWPTKNGGWWSSESLAAALKDLKCEGDMQREIDEVTHYVRRRYALAGEMRERLASYDEE